MAKFLGICSATRSIDVCLFGLCATMNIFMVTQKQQKVTSVSTLSLSVLQFPYCIMSIIETPPSQEVCKDEHVKDCEIFDTLMIQNKRIP